MKIVSFGKLAGIVAPDMQFEAMADTDSLRTFLEGKYPALKETKYVIAVNKEIVRENRPLDSKSEVALLPPFSGG